MYIISLRLCLVCSSRKDFYNLKVKKKILLREVPLSVFRFWLCEF